MKPLTSPRPAGRLRRHRRAEPFDPPAPVTLDPPPTPEQRARAAGGPEDRALYTCGCGAAFRADVQVDVPCPACGAAQTW
jgi:hypothetical protein